MNLVKSSGRRFPDGSAVLGYGLILQTGLLVGTVIQTISLIATLGYEALLCWQAHDLQEKRRRAIGR
ncbi:MAG: hypothetical protein Q4F79_04310 [Eubacteriales bacterium]|nr:hypothetical protein [Eubacteriales bacterium]